jgi:hypothetical protein
MSNPFYTIAQAIMITVTLWSLGLPEIHIISQVFLSAICIIVVLYIRDLSLKKEYTSMKQLGAEPLVMLSNGRSPTSIGYYWSLPGVGFRPMRYSEKYLKSVFDQEGTATMFGNPFGL